MDAYDDWEFSDSESVSEEIKSSTVTHKPSYVLIAIDTDSSMFEPNDSNHSPFIDCLEACYKLADFLVMGELSSVKGPLGIMLAENDSAKATFVEFDHTIPDTLKLLKGLKKQSNESLKSKYERIGHFDLADFFLACKNKLVQVNADVYKRTIIYITNDDDPVEDDPRKRFKIINESQKFPSVQMSLNVVTFKQEFKDDFYSEILAAAASPPVEKIETAPILTEKLSSMFQVKFPKYKYKFYPFKGDSESYIQVRANKHIQTQRIYKNMHVTRDTQKEVKKSFRQNETTGEFQCLYSKNEPPLILNEAEKVNLYETDLPIGYTLLYVSEPTLNDGWVIEPAVLVEKDNKEPELIFESFWQFCKEKSKCLVCLRKQKKAGNVRYVEFIPKYVNNTKMFLVQVLPFRQETHYIPPVREKLEVDPEQEQAMNDLVEALTFDYDPRNFSDPVNGKKRAYIKSQILNEPMVKVIDGIPSDKQIDERIAEEITELGKLDLLDLPVENKRAKSNTGGDRKKLKMEK